MYNQSILYTHTHKHVYILSYIKWGFVFFLSFFRLFGGSLCSLCTRRRFHTTPHIFCAYLRTVCITFWFHKRVSPRRRRRHRRCCSFFIFFGGDFCLYFSSQCTKYTKIPTQRYHWKSIAHRHTTARQRKFRLPLSLDMPLSFSHHFPCIGLMKFDGVLRSINFYYTIFIVCFPFDFHVVDYWVRWSNYVDRLLKISVRMCLCVCLYSFAHI